jgi:hypothetical protein
MWTWIATGVGVLLALATVVALVVARTLGVIAEEVSGLHETEDWASLPLARDAEVRADAEPEERVLTG